MKTLSIIKKYALISIITILLSSQLNVIYAQENSNNSFDYSDPVLANWFQENPFEESGSKQKFSQLREFLKKDFLKTKKMANAKYANRFARGTISHTNHVLSMVMMMAAMHASTGFDEYTKSHLLYIQNPPSLKDRISFIGESLYDLFTDGEFLMMWQGSAVLEGMLRIGGSEKVFQGLEGLMTGVAGKTAMGIFIHSFLKTAYAFGFWEFFKGWIDMAKELTEMWVYEQPEGFIALYEEHMPYITDLKKLFSMPERLRNTFLNNLGQILKNQEYVNLLFWNIFRKQLLSGDFVTLVGSMTLAGELVGAVLGGVAGGPAAPLTSIEGLFVGAVIGALSGIIGFVIHELIPEKVKLGIDGTFKSFRFYNNEFNVLANSSSLKALIDHGPPPEDTADRWLEGNGAQTYRYKEASLEGKLSTRKDLRKLAFTPLFEWYDKLSIQINKNKEDINQRLKLREKFCKNPDSVTGAKRLSTWFSYSDWIFRQASIPFSNANLVELLWPPSANKAIAELIDKKEISSLILETRAYIKKRYKVNHNLRKAYIGEELFLMDTIGETFDHYPDNFDPNEIINQYRNNPEEVADKFRAQASVYFNEYSSCSLKLQEVKDAMYERTFIAEDNRIIGQYVDDIFTEDQCNENTRISDYLPPVRITFPYTEKNKCLNWLFKSLQGGKIRTPEDLMLFDTRVLKLNIFRDYLEDAHNKIKRSPEIQQAIRDGASFKDIMKKDIHSESYRPRVLQEIKKVRRLKQYTHDFTELNYERILTEDCITKQKNEYIFNNMSETEKAREYQDADEEKRKITESEMAIEAINHADKICMHTKEAQDLFSQILFARAKLNLLGWNEDIFDLANEDLVEIYLNDISRGKEPNPIDLDDEEVTEEAIYEDFNSGTESQQRFEDYDDEVQIEENRYDPTRTHVDPDSPLAIYFDENAPIDPSVVNFEREQTLWKYLRSKLDSINTFSDVIIISNTIQQNMKLPNKEAFEKEHPEFFYALKDLEQSIMLGAVNPRFLGPRSIKELILVGYGWKLFTDNAADLSELHDIQAFYTSNFQYIEKSELLMASYLDLLLSALSSEEYIIRDPLTMLLQSGQRWIQFKQLEEMKSWGMEKLKDFYANPPARDRKKINAASMYIELLDYDYRLLQNSSVIDCFFGYYKNFY
ncbi:MAG: hypothetical protein ABIA04_04805 [Pseudomonadota bacterium]